MNRPVQSPQRSINQMWDRLVQVSVPLEDPDQIRIGTLFNTLIIVAMVMTLTLSVPLFVAWRRGYFLDPLTGAVSAFSPFFLLPVAVLCFMLVKRGHLRFTIPLYVWFNLVVIISTCILFGGSSSVGWIMLFWPITLAGTLMKPVDTIRFTFVSVVLYSIVAWAQGTGRFTPLFTIAPGTTQFLTIAFYWVMLIIVGGIVNYLNVASLRKALQNSQEATKLAESIQAELEERVEERTTTLAHRAEQFQTIAELGKVTSTVRDERTLLDTVVSLISDQMDFYHVAVFVLDPGGEWAILQAASSDGGMQMLEKGHRLRVGQQGVVGYVSQTGLPRFAFDVGEDAVWFNNPDLPDTKSEIALPLVSAGSVFGVLDIQTRQTAAFDEQDIEVLNVLADSVAVAIVNTRLLSETQIALERLERYQEQDAVKAWRQALARRHLQVGYSYQSGLVRPMDNLIHTSDEYKTGDAVCVSETETGMHQLSATLSVGGNPAGYLTFERSTPWSDETVQLVDSVVTQLDLALNNARLLEETRLRARQEAARSDIVERVRALTSTDAIMRSAVEELGKALRVERSRIQLVQYSDES